MPLPSTAKLFGVTVVVLGDQISKAVALASLLPGMPVKVIPGFQLTLALNRGIAFSQFSGATGWQYHLLVGFIILLALVIAYHMMKANDTGTAVGLMLLTGGAIGNLLDRLFYGAIVDFIELYCYQWHWPVFNVADIAIFAGVVILAWRWGNT